jgi:hypothetical protein
MQLQGHISVLIDKIQEFTIPRAGLPQVWCTGCYTEGHMTMKCPRMRGKGPPPKPIVPPLVEPLEGVVQVASIVPFHGPVQYHTFPNNQGS